MAQSRDDFASLNRAIRRLSEAARNTQLGPIVMPRPPVPDPDPHLRAKVEAYAGQLPTCYGLDHDDIARDLMLILAGSYDPRTGPVTR